MKWSLKNKILFGVLLFAVLMASAYMGAASVVMRQQYLDESHRMLKNAAGIVEAALNLRRERVQSAARDLASQKNLGADLWYLTRYGQENLDQETLSSTYRQLAQDVLQIARRKNIPRLAIYDMAGHLLVFARKDDAHWQTGFVQTVSTGGIHLANISPTGELRWQPMSATRSLASLRFDEAIPRTERAFYARVDGHLVIRAEIPVMGEMFEPGNNGPVREPMGFVDAILPFDSTYLQQIAHLTGTHVNLFLGNVLDMGDIASYRSVNRMSDYTTLPSGNLLFNTVNIQGNGYYQCLFPLVGDHGVTGSVALLQSMEVINKNIWQMIGILWWIALGSVLLIIPLAWYFAVSLTSPITLLIGMFRKMARGDRRRWSARERLLMHGAQRRRDELGELALGFMAMNDAIAQKIDEIRDMNASLEQKVADRTAALSAKEAETRTLIENSPDTIVRYDRECRRIYVNPALSDAIEGGSAAVLHKTPIETLGTEEGQAYQDKIRQVFATGLPVEHEVTWRNKQDRTVHSHVRLTPEFDASGNVSSALGIGRDMTDRMAFEQTIWRQANYDTLTHLPNRQMFQDTLYQETQSMLRHGHSLALLLIDLDRFKEVNDALGHDKGDSLLIQAAHRIRSCVRENDTVSRLGGDEFTVIIGGFDDVTTVERIARDIIDRLSLPFDLAGEQAYISASIGISRYPQDATELDTLFKHADQAMYAAKNNGRNQFYHFTPDLQQAADMRLRMTNDLRHALADGQLVIHYQPIIELTSGKLYKIEALLRWQHPERGTIDPTSFIALAEETGLIVSIGDWVFGEVVQQTKSWQKKCVNPVRISVNKSPVQIHQRDQPVSWPEVVRTAGLDARQVTIEITEGVLLDANDDVRARLTELRQAGMQLALDDFGTGYSSLSYLKKFDIDFLKIDRSYIQHLENDPDQRVLCEAIIVMAHTLGLQVIAEGVETAAQQQLLLAAGCDYAQGFLYDRPLPADMFEQRWLIAGKPA